MFNKLDEIIECDVNLEARALEKKMEKGEYKSILDLGFNPGPEK